MWVGAACSAISPNQSSDVMAMHKWFADEAVLVIKQKADENMVTYLRIQTFESAMECKDEGRNMLTCIGVHEEPLP